MIKHGTLGGYLRCRCELCVAFHNAYNREAVRQRRWYNGDVPHGTLGGYKNYRCRCDACNTANTDYQREYLRKRAGQRIKT